MPQNRADEKRVSAPSSIRNPFRVGILRLYAPRVGRKKHGQPWAVLRNPFGVKAQVLS